MTATLHVMGQILIVHSLTTQQYSWTKTRKGPPSTFLLALHVSLLCSYIIMLDAGWLALYHARIQNLNLIGLSFSFLYTIGLVFLRVQNLIILRKFIIFTCIYLHTS